VNELSTDSLRSWRRRNRLALLSETICLSLIFSSVACAQSSFAKQAASTSDIFVDITQKLGVSFQYKASHTSKKYLPETMGAGVALFDYDNDGRLDLFLVNGAPLPDPSPKKSIPVKTGPEYWNRLYHQKPDGSFEDVTEKAGLQGAGYGMGVAVGDYDNDGFEDLYVTAYGGNRLYHNNGDGTFSDVTPKAGVAGSGWSTSAAWVDLDADGFLDLIVLRYLEWDFDDIWCGEHKEGFRAYCHPDFFKPISPLVYHNNKDGTFSEMSQKVGIAKPGKGLGIAIADYDRDGHIDLFVANDSMAEFLYHNKGDGTFEEVGLTSQVAVDIDGRTYAGMGVDFADYNNDGWPDIVVTDLANQRYPLYQNTGDGSFTYATSSSGLGQMTVSHSGWGVRLFDYDNDGWKDLFVAQAHVLDTVAIDFPSISYRQRLLLLRNVRGRFQDVSDQAGQAFRVPLAARGAAFGDFNNDGWMDVVVNANDGPPLLLRNNGGKSNWILIDTIGSSSNRDGIGARIRIAGESGLEQYGFVSTASSYLSASDKRIHFGFGSDRRIREIEIRWPSGTVQHLTDVAVNQILRVKEPR